MGLLLLCMLATGECRGETEDNGLIMTGDILIIMQIRNFSASSSSS